MTWVFTLPGVGGLRIQRMGRRMLAHARQPLVRPVCKGPGNGDGALRVKTVCSPAGQAWRTREAGFRGMEIAKNYEPSTFNGCFACGLSVGAAVVRIHPLIRTDSSGFYDV
jgi:hypothetical protein